MSCDDHCSFKINTSPDPLDPLTVEQILWRRSWTYYRNTDIADKLNPGGEGDGDGWRYSKWMTLQQDVHYYVESTLLQGGGYINLDIGMEIIPEVMPAYHPRFERQVQQVSIG